MTEGSKNMDEEVEVIKELARAKYAARVCGYLELDDIEKCKKVFDKLYANMKAAFEGTPCETLEKEEIPEEYIREAREILKAVLKNER